MVRDADGEAGLLVRRFDRITVNGQPVSLAVEDACQAMNRPPADKYTVGTEAAIAALARVCQAPVVAARTHLMQLVFAYLTGNGDPHAKNFSVLCTPDGEWRPTPAYDVPSSQPYGDTTMALSIAGRTTGDIGGSTFIALGATLGVRERAVRRLVDEICERASLWMLDLDQLPFDRGRVRNLRRVIDYRTRRLSQ